MLYAENYGMVAAKHVDPIEKKPLYHFYPGRGIYSIGTVGCNMHCLFCQNCEISQTSVKAARFLKYMEPGDVVKEARAHPESIGIAYTYNEPGVWFEYIMEVARKAKEVDLKNVMVSNGYINEIPLREILEVMDAFNIDLKGYTEDFYKTQTFSSLNPVIDTIREVSVSGKHLEITNLVIPLLNDDPDIFEEMCIWLADEIGQDTVLHLSKYFPSYKKTLPSTPENKLVEFYHTAKKYLWYVYIGNVSHGSIGKNTICPKCKTTVIERSGYSTKIFKIDTEGKCTVCNTPILEHI
jgi:pyruvate formate lyase activating enzyme